MSLWTYFSAQIAILDEAVGNITDALRFTERWENTVFIFSSDNGGPTPVLNSVGCNYPLRGSKGTLWEGGESQYALQNWEFLEGEFESLFYMMSGLLFLYLENDVGVHKVVNSHFSRSIVFWGYITLWLVILGTRVAGFIGGPLAPAPDSVYNGMMHISDWYPTILSLAGVEIPIGVTLDGFNQWPAISQAKSSPRTVSICAFWVRGPRHLIGHEIYLWNL